MLSVLIANVNLLKCLFVFMASSILVLSLLVNFFEHYLPATIIQTFRYGKFSYAGQKSYINYLELPKRWFKHFYVIATLYSAIILSLLVCTYMISFPKAAEGFNTVFDVFATKDRIVTVNATTAFLATILLCSQIWRRFYETFIISVFSDCKINIVHYLIGIIHYLGATTAIIIEAPGFAVPSFKHKATLSIWDLCPRSVFGTVVFLWAWYHQYRCAVILADLRKDKKGTVVTYEHRLPVGGLFDRLSSPHMFCEMTMYFALNLILWGHTTWPYVFFWVLCNQCETALLNHWWYKSNFKAYPKERKAFLPFVF